MPASEFPNVNYHIARDGQQIGTFSKDEVLAKIQQGSIKPSDLAWTEGMSEWKPVSLVFAEAFGGPTPPGLPATPPSAVSTASTGMPAPSPAGPSVAPPPRPNNFLLWSVLATIFCCLPFGIVSIIFASQVDSKYSSGDYAGAQSSADKAKLWFWIAFGIGVLQLIGGLIYFFVVMAAAAAAASGAAY